MKLDKGEHRAIGSNGVNSHLTKASDVVTKKDDDTGSALEQNDLTTGGLGSSSGNDEGMTQHRVVWQTSLYW